MEFKGTKGKWKVSKYNYDEIKSDSGFCICDVWDMDTETFPNPSEAKANALLISKAPEMLEMLKKMVNEFDVEFTNQYQFDLHSKAKQLIKEATEI